jgi:signal peptidase I
MTEPRPRRWTIRKVARELSVLAVFSIILLAGRSSLADHYRVPSGSMEPTIEIGDRILVSKAAYGVRVPFTGVHVARFEGPELGDVVVLDSPVEDKVLLKRVVGGPGMVVEVRGGKLRIDGVLAPVEQRADGLHEKLGSSWHPVRLTHDGGPEFGPVTIPADRYLVMGDNRGDSADGRVFGLVTRDAILGRAVAVYWRGGPTWDAL